MKKLVCLVNYRSRLGKHLLKDLEKIGQSHGIQLSVHVIEADQTRDQQILALAKNLGSDERLVVVGGDGTLNEALNVIKGAGLSTPIGHLPAGSGNDFARSLAISRDPAVELEKIAQLNQAKALDVIELRQGDQTYYALNSVGFGLDGLTNEVILSWPKSLKSSLGGFSYLPAAGIAYSQLEAFPIQLELDGVKRDFQEVKLLLIGNNPYFGGGVEILPEAKATDGILDVLIADEVVLKDLLRLVPRLFINRSHLKDRSLKAVSARSGSLQMGQGIGGQMDGEVIHSQDARLYFTTKKHHFWI